MPHKRRNGRETLKAFSERALQATMDGTLIPPMVYIPVNLRRSKARLAEDVITTNAKNAAEVEAQISQADPDGFLIAIMQGQPIPCFVLHKDDDGLVEVRMEYSVPDLLLRSEVAMELARRKARARINNSPDEIAYKAMIEKAADGIR